MPQGLLGFHYEDDSPSAATTALGGLPAYLDLILASGLKDSIARRVRAAGKQGWTDVQALVSLILLNLTGGDCVEDLEGLEKDTGLTRLLRKFETHGLKQRRQRALAARHRRGRQRTVPSPVAMLSYLARFHDQAEEAKREDGKAFIPAATAGLRGLLGVNRDLVGFFQRKRPMRRATLDMDATLVETHKKQALFCYKHYRAYQPLNTWWAEQGVILHTEFRDGNVPAGHQQLRVLKESLGCLPAGVVEVFMRTDTAGYQRELLRYCAQGENERFGVIGFAVGADVTPAFKRAVAVLPESAWQPLLRKLDDGSSCDTGQQWAEVCFVPNWAGHSKNAPDYRYLAIREPLQQPALPSLEPTQEELPFPTMSFGREPYKLFGLVSNRDLPGDELIWWSRERCGKSEQAHAVMKHDLAGGKLPSKLFGANAAWWMAMVLAHNLNAAMTTLVLGDGWLGKRLKAIRFHLINLPGRVLSHGRRLVLRLAHGHPSLSILLAARQRIAMLAQGP